MISPLQLHTSLPWIFISFSPKWGFPDSSVGKESTCNTGDPGLGRSSGEGKGYPLQYSGLENSMDSPWGCKESDTTEWLSLSLFSQLTLSLLPSSSLLPSLPPIPPFPFGPLLELAIHWKLLIWRCFSLILLCVYIPNDSFDSSPVPSGTPC